jgi:putative N6-adenine-specific DNA methylase
VQPPYGIRLRPTSEIRLFYREIGDFLKQRCAGATAFIYFGDREMLKHIGLRPSWKRPLKSGGLDGRLAKFEMYAGAEALPSRPTAPSGTRPQRQIR